MITGRSASWLSSSNSFSAQGVQLAVNIFLNMFDEVLDFDVESSNSVEIARAKLTKRSGKASQRTF